MKKYSNYDRIQSQMKRLFRRIDYNGNGLISKNELKQFFEQHKFRNEAAVEELMFEFDVDLDGVIDYYEFKAIMQEVNKIKQKEPTKQQLHKAFRTFDLDGNQLISFRQFTKIAKKYDRSLNRKELQQIFNEMDQNRNGYINFQQFDKYFTQQSEE